MSARGLRWLTLAGITCVVLGAVIALLAVQASGPVPGEAVRYAESSVPSVALGWFLLVGGVVLAAGALGFTLGARRRMIR